MVMMHAVLHATLVLLALVWLSPAAAVVRPNGQPARPKPPADWVPPVLAKLNPAICNHKTGAITDANLARVKRQAAAAGLQFERALAVRCWYRFKQTGSMQQTQKALASLTVSQQQKGQTGGSTVSVSNTGEPLPFALAEFDQLMHVMQPAGAATAGVAGRAEKSATAVSTARPAVNAANSGGGRSVAAGGSLQVVSRPAGASGLQTARAMAAGTPLRRQ